MVRPTPLPPARKSEMRAWLEAHVDSECDPATEAELEGMLALRRVLAARAPAEGPFLTESTLDENVPLLPNVKSVARLRSAWKPLVAAAILICVGVATHRIWTKVEVGRDSRPDAGLEARARAYLQSPAPSSKDEALLRKQLRFATYENQGRVGPSQKAILRDGDAGMIIPHYFHLMDETERLIWNRIVALRDDRLPVKLVNTRTDPKMELTPNGDFARRFREALDYARQHRVEVFAFITCDGALKPLSIAKKEVSHWHSLFGDRLSGIFFDNQPMDKDDRVDYFRELFAYTRNLAPSWQLISATGSSCAEAYIQLQKDSIICYKSQAGFIDIKGWEHTYPRGRFGALVMNDRNSFADIMDRASTWFGWIFVIDSVKPGEDPYKILPASLELQAETLKRINSESRQSPPSAEGARNRSRSS